MHRVRIFEHVRASLDARHLHEGIFITIVRPILVEFVGTFFLVLLTLWSACSADSHLLQGALSGGFTLTCLLACFGHISGTHLNPCVTLGIWIAGEVRSLMAIIYFIAQITAGIIAAGFVRLLLDKSAYDTCNGGRTSLNDLDWWQGLLIEMFITYVLVTVIVQVALDTKSKTGLAPILIGLTLSGNILAVGPYTGGSMNPARSFGPAVISNYWKDHWVYWVGPLLGAAIAGLTYRFLWSHHDRRWPKIKKKQAKGQLDQNQEQIDQQEYNS